MPQPYARDDPPANQGGKVPFGHVEEFRGFLPTEVSRIYLRVDLLHSALAFCHFMALAAQTLCLRASQTIRA